MINLAFAAFQDGELARAETLSRDFLAANPDHEAGLFVLGLSLQHQQRYPEAIATLRRLTELHPGSAEHWSNLGNLYRQAGQPAEAEAALQRGVQLSNGAPGMLMNLALHYIDVADFPQAQALLEDALKKAPDDLEVRLKYAHVCYDSGDNLGVERALEGWQRWPIDDPRLLADAGWLLMQIGFADQGEAALERAADLAPSDPKIRVLRALFLERVNRIDDAESLLASIRDTDLSEQSDVEDLLAARARIALRRRDLAGSRTLHEALIARIPYEERRGEALFSLAKVCDTAGDTTAAMAALDAAHAAQLRRVRSLIPDLVSGRSVPLSIAEYRVTPEEYAAWPPLPVPSAEDSPIFVVGFPRSGTTMLETMLDAHPALRSMDERPFLQNVVDAVFALGLKYPEELGRLSADQCDRLRALYWQLVRQRVTLPPGTRLVDKNPLNLLRLPLIRRLFPNAKIILALRHPCDVVLSCYMQSFRSPVFVAMCENLATTAEGYARSMRFWTDQAQVLEASVHELRYEDFVRDVAGRARGVIDYLGLPWDERVVHFHEQAKERGFISTPSYSQVIEPVYTRSIDRWRKYEPFFAAALPHLKPYAQRWGYTLE